MNKKIIIITMIIIALIFFSGCIDDITVKAERNSKWVFVEEFPTERGLFKIEDGNNTCYVLRDGNNRGEQLFCLKNN